jgi:hypothetical protein
MGMAMVGRVYPRPFVSKQRRGSMWKVTWCDAGNQVWYREFVSWNRAVYFATTGKQPYGI